MIRLGIIGCGDVVNLYKGFSSEPLKTMGLEVTALVDSNLENTKKIASYFANPILTTSFDEHVIAATDAVLIAAPNHLHHHYGKLCLEAGKHVLMEKPLALTRVECEELIAISSRKNLILMVALCMRFHPLLQQFKSLLDKRQCGDLFQLSIWTEQHTEFPQDHWHNQQETLGGGQLFSHGCHYIDLLMWFLGQPVEGFFWVRIKKLPGWKKKVQPMSV
ncbi:Gfo/Idh/MocA family protein [Legionella tunisiensis]|uniref:Gfo/Idh/MocA family protein n=1 Tax=Legionella tunisiensis TaxID=1034944 RepID=UPI0002D44621|nr:Gfo/Idh/MocA family oxidoreductase [Legionella tunisiensis]